MGIYIIFQGNEQFEAILAGREKRVKRQRELIRLFAMPLLSFSLNIPGPDKLSRPWAKVFAAGLDAVAGKLRERSLESRYRETGGTAAGHEAFWIVEADAVRLKELAMVIERDHPLGRLFDIDVFDEYAEQFSRESRGGEKRPCVICGGNTALCRRSGRHTLENVLRRFEEIARAYFLSPPEPGKR